jgi:phosphatidylglycerol lysyltransferase
LKHHGFKGFCFGQEALINLQKFNLNGKKKSSIRSSVNHSIKNHLQVEEYNHITNKSLDIEQSILNISQEWCSLQNMPELNFAFGHVSFDMYPDARYFICKDKKKIVGFLNYYPIFDKQSYYLDLTRRRVNSPRGTIDFLIVKSIEQLKNENIQSIYIGGSPLYYQFINSSINTPFITNLFSLLKESFEFFYPTKSEFFFKKKYAPDWEPYFIYYYPRFNIRIFLAIIDAIYNGGIASMALYKIKNFLSI